MGVEKKKAICKISFSGDFPDKKNIDIEFYKHKGLLKFNDFDKCTILQNMIDVLTEVQESYANKYYNELVERGEALGSGMFEADEAYLKNSKRWQGEVFVDTKN